MRTENKPSVTYQEYIQIQHMRSWNLLQRFKSVCAFSQSDQSLSFPTEEALDPWLPIERLSKTLIRLRGCAG